MPLRFIDTGFYKNPFVRGLKGAYKALYHFIITDCDNAGIWSPEFEISGIYIDHKVDRKSAEENFSGKFVPLPNGKWFFPDFIQWQYPQGLQKKNPAHTKVIKCLLELNLIDSNLKVRGAPKELQRSLKAPKDKDKEEGKEEEKDKGMGKDTVHPLQNWIKGNLPQVSKLDTQLTFAEATKLTQQNSLALVEEILEAMENKKDLLKKYKSVYRTVNQWIKLRKNGTNQIKFGSNQVASATVIEPGREFGKL